LDEGKQDKKLVIPDEVLQELLHIYLPVDRMGTLDAALELATRVIGEVFINDLETVLHARRLIDRHLGLTTRYLLHLSI
jgi:hypothetical protein